MQYQQLADGLVQGSHSHRSSSHNWDHRSNFSLSSRPSHRATYRKCGRGQTESFQNV